MSTSTPGRPGGIGAVRASTLLIVVWSFAALTAVLCAGLLHFWEVHRDCAGVATTRFAENVEIHCSGAGDTTATVPMSGAAVVVFFAAAGLLVLTGATIWYAAARRREQYRVW
ncbi:hypothetical protein [Saccharomonospora halophila]|uniref:hypothetical protein n=1 Tax=Saccharomonospora halophila TaxID=129922 RepID=UPI00035C231F|nr:hypothetical protein [Saccharomonospora halophila]